jgi:hypothetical protein
MTIKEILENPDDWELVPSSDGYVIKKKEEPEPKKAREWWLNKMWSKSDMKAYDDFDESMHEQCDHNCDYLGHFPKSIRVVEPMSREDVEDAIVKACVLKPHDYDKICDVLEELGLIEKEDDNENIE